ncbi:MAG TPA: leucine-rich repeat domain-containing protein [Cytophagaceae bacterium]|jgi:Leucine-rich repeat (LRR) protein|nr:leucine-rich repeat domain-containing protein [Cytophagaceae bacterium]
MNILKLLLVFTSFLLIGKVQGQNKSDSTGVNYESQVVNVAGNFNLNITAQPDKLTSFPLSICKLSYLNVINLVSHNITSIPPEIADIKELVVLNMPNNKLTSLPKEIGQLTKLRNLNLSKNQLTTLPEELGNCKNLKTLNVSENNISQSEIDKIQKLLPNCIITIKSKMAKEEVIRQSSY